MTASLGRRGIVAAVLVVTMGVAVKGSPEASAGGASTGLQVIVETRFAEVTDVLLRDVGADVRGLDNQVVVTALDSGSGDDLVIGDLSGIVDPVPPPFVRVDDTTVRAPANLLFPRLEIRPQLGAGRDTLSLTLALNPVLEDLAEVDGSLGSGGDQMRDMSKLVDSILGGRGADRIEVGPARDRTKGGPGTDVIKGGPARDRLLGGPGTDFLIGGRAFDYLDGGGQRDRCDGGPRKDAYIRCELVEGRVL